VLTPRNHQRAARGRALPALLALTAAAAVLAAVTSPGQRTASSLGRVRLAAASGGPLSTSQAQAQAKATGQPVTVSALTTPSSVTTANPDGTFTTDEAAEPVRAWRDGGWASLDPALHANPDGTISPAVTSSGLALSGGGTGALAVMTAAGRRLSLSWPTALPAPALSGATATYPNVLPGVDLVVTADDQGGFSDVLVVKDAAAAANPALASLKLTASAPGLAISADAAGDLTASTGPSSPPVFTAPAPLMWDSAAAPAGQAAVTAPGGASVTAGGGMPTTSSAAAPGAGAHVATVPVTASAKAITLTPPAAALTGSSTVYPVYIDPTWHPVGSTVSAWTQVDKGYPTTSYWKESSDLQSGKCDFAGCNNVQVARSFIRLPIPSQLTSASVVHTADLYMTEQWAPSCTKKSVRLYTTGGISSSTTWNNQPSWPSSFLYQDAAFGYPGCGYYKDDITWNVTSTISGDAGSKTSQTWGIRAADETNDLGWKQFFSGSSSKYHPHLSVTYNDPPNNPTARSSSPGGSCKYSASIAPTIGNDDVTLFATASDDDGDNSLTTRFLVLNSSGTVVYDSSTKGTSFTGGNNAAAHLLLTRADFQGFSGDGQQHTYHWYAITTDDNGLTSKTPADDCYFKYNPAAPGAPTVGLSSTSGQLGQQLGVTFTAPAGACPGSGCPLSYTYQLGASTPVSVTADASGNWSGNITIPRVGPMVLTVSGVASGGNPGEAATPQITGQPPATPYADGDINGNGQADLLTLGSSSKPSLWLSSGNGAGGIGNAADIGGAGTGISPGTDGPADWSGTQVLHGDFTGNHDQDVMAYYPAGNNAGTAVILAGSGDGAPLSPFSGTSFLLEQAFMDPVTADMPQTLVAAGNASQLGTGVADLIGIAGDTTGSGDNYTLDLFTSCAGCGPIGYEVGTAAVLSATAPDGTSDWEKYQLATAQPGGQPVLLALDTATGAMWESVNPSPGAGPCADYTQSTCTVIGTPNSTWTRITAPWGGSAPKLVSGDVNAAGKIELWTVSGTNTTAYTITGTSLSQEATDTIAPPYNDWPLADGNGSSAGETIAGKDAILNGGATWTDNSGTSFGNYITVDGSSGYLAPPAGTIPSAATQPKISVWFRTATAGGVLVGIASSPLPSGSSTSYDPLLYIGTDGHLYGEWWNGSSTSPAVSATRVDDGIWHHAVLTANASSQTLYLDNQPGISISGSTNISGQGSNLSFGAGYIGGNWPSEPNYKQAAAPSYFNGDIAAITYSYPGGP
jgi:hypothetical protein